MRPRLFILGAPKCGTTALCDYLSRHAKICFSEPKEAKFFHQDFSPEHRLCSSEKEYMRSFAHRTEEHSLLAEGTVWYLYSQVAVEKILKFNPEARFVVMLRNPVDLSYSLHSQLLYGGDEDVEDFEQAWRLQEPRAEGQRLPRFCRDPKSLQYREVASLGAQVERLLSQVGRDRVRFLVFDDFIRDPGAAYREVLEFVGLEDDGRAEFPRVNENKVLKRGLLPKIMFHAAAVKRALGIRRSMGVWRRMQPALAETRKRAPMSPQLREELCATFREDVELLSRLLERDLTPWCGLEPAARNDD